MGKRVRCYVDNKLKEKLLGMWLTWWSICLASTGPEFKPTAAKKYVCDPLFVKGSGEIYFPECHEE